MSATGDMHDRIERDLQEEIERLKYELDAMTMFHDGKAMIKVSKFLTKGCVK